MTFSNEHSQNLNAPKIILKRVYSLSNICFQLLETLAALNCLKLTIKTLEQSVKYVQS